MSSQSFVNSVWHYTGMEAMTNWLYNQSTNMPKNASGKACCTAASGVDKVKGHCGGQMTRFYGRGGGGGPCFVRLAGLSGAIAVGLGAYGAHVFSKKPVSDELKKVYETGNHYHLIHSLALLGVPLTRRPGVTGGLFVLGMLLFCGSCYVHALTEYKPVREVTPYGGMLLILGWISIFV